MIVVITKYGRCPLPLSYTEEQLRRVVEEFVFKAPGIFKYSELYGYVMNRALHDGAFKTEPYTRYTNIVLTEQDEHCLAMILWEMIWERRLVIEFRNSDQRSNGDMSFGIVGKL